MAEFEVTADGVEYSQPKDRRHRRGRVGKAGGTNGTMDREEGPKSKRRCLLALERGRESKENHCSPPPSRAAPASEFEKLKDRLRSHYEGGDVIPLPWLKASHAAPLALLDPITAEEGIKARSSPPRCSPNGLAGLRKLQRRRPSRRSSVWPVLRSAASACRRFGLGQAAGGEEEALS